GEVGGDDRGGGGDGVEVRATFRGQRCGYTDDDRAGRRQTLGVVGGAKVLLQHRRDVFRGQVVDVGTGLVQAVDDLVVHVEAGHVESCGRGFGRQRQADVAQAQHDEVAHGTVGQLGNSGCFGGCGIHFVVTLAFISWTGTHESRSAFIGEWDVSVRGSVVLTLEFGLVRTI